MSEPICFDMNAIFPGKADPQTFAAKVDAHNFAVYQAQHVQLRGCAPSWAHLLVAAQLLPVVVQLDFLLDDGHGGQVIPIAPTAP
ncbi:MAG: hypothetical protein HY696_00845 [Deltaproteobacteria bacterium]|nr:hypothetical protein [Deltaproteobacteria bacterium]